MTTELRARFARKPHDLDCVLQHGDASAQPEPIVIEFRKDLTEAEYDAFAKTLLDDRDWLAGRGGYLEGGGRSVVEVSAPNRTTLYVDPSGGNYGRYVGVRVE